MIELPAYFSVLVTLGLVLTRPRFGSLFRVGPAFAAVAGVLVMLTFGVVDRADLIASARLMWRPLTAVASIMVTTAVARHTGLMDWLSSIAEARGGEDATRLFACVYGLSAVTAAVLNNDSAILLLTPLVITLVRRRYPAHPALVVPFAFAVFMAAGVAPLIVSNPMNMIVASYAGIDFNAYAAVMAPIALAGWLVGFAMLRLAFQRELRSAMGARAARVVHAPSTAAQREALVLVVLVLSLYPAVAYAGGPVWLVSAAGALLSLALAARHRVASPRRVLAEGVSWNILAFLVAVSVLGVGLRHVGVVQRLSVVYAHGGVAGIGVVSAIGSAIVNNHPMSIMNMVAMQAVPGAGPRETLAALIGGDLGPRLLPMGSLAGLLWFESLRQRDVQVSALRFAAVGAAVTLPTLAVSLGVLYLIT